MPVAGGGRRIVASFTAALVGAAAIAVLVWPGAAGADQLTGKPSTTAISGRAGTDRTLAKPGSSNDAIYGVIIAERSDDPCFLQANFRDVTSNATSSLRFAECDDNNRNEGTDRSRVSMALPEGVFVTGINICLNGNRDKMKGIQLIGRYSGCVLGQPTYVASSECTFFKANGIEYRLCNTDNAPYREVDCGIAVTRYYERTNCPGSKRDRTRTGRWRGRARRTWWRPA